MMNNKQTTRILNGNCFKFPIERLSPTGYIKGNTLTGYNSVI